MITVVFKNSIQLEGNLISISEDGEMVLQSLSGIEETVIPNIRDTVLFYKINSAKEKFEEIAEKPEKSREDLEQIVRARGDLLAIERSTIREKMRAPIEKREEVNEIPNITEHTETKTTRKNNSVASGLSRMFSKRS